MKILTKALTERSEFAASYLAQRHGGVTEETTAAGGKLWAVRGCRADKQTALECIWFAITTLDTERCLCNVDVFDRDGLLICDVWQ